MALPPPRLAIVLLPPPKPVLDDLIERIEPGLVGRPKVPDGLRVSKEGAPDGGGQYDTWREPPRHDATPYHRQRPRHHRPR